MGPRHLLDSNILIYYLDNQVPADSMATMDQIVREGGQLSVISQIEVPGWNAPNENSAQKAEIFVENSAIFPLNEAVVHKTISLRKTYRIKLPDAIIAATALVHGFTLVSRNEADFGKIAGLLFWNPFTSPAPPSVP